MSSTGVRAFALSSYDVPHGHELVVRSCEDCACPTSGARSTRPDRTVHSGRPLVRSREVLEMPLDSGHWVLFAPQGNGGVVVQMPNGQLFNTISNGYNTMMGYAQQITPADRWAIVLYVRALQRAQNSTLAEVPQDDAKCQNMAMPSAPTPAAPTPAPAAGSAAPATENK